MNLAEMLFDLSNRLDYVEKNQYKEMARCEARIEAFEKKYNRKCGDRPSLALIGVIFGLGALGLACFIADKMLGGEPPDTMTKIIVIVVGVAAAVLGIVLTVVIYAVRESAAEAWWKNTAKPQVLEQKRLYKEYQDQAVGIISQNYMVTEIPDVWFNSKDCGELAELADRYSNASMKDLYYMYKDILAARERYAEEQEWRNNALDEITSRLDKQQKSLDRAEYTRNMINNELFAIRHDLD